MAKAKPDQEDDSPKADETTAAQDEAQANLFTDTGSHPINMLLDLATDDNVETHEGTEVKVDNVREAAGNALLTKTELQKYDDYKKQWASALERPQESLDNLARRERQIIEAAANHDWEALDRLKKEVDADIERMQYIMRGYSNS
jgi:hypothetical protein